MLRIQRGIPASGKSTDARKWVAESPTTRVRINRDDIRFQLFGKYWPVDEALVTATQDSMLRALLKKCDVVLDNTNLKTQDVKSVLRIAADCDVEVEFKDFPISLEDALQRDLWRGNDGERAVGYSVVESFYNRYTPKGVFPPIPTIDAKVSTSFKPYVYDPALPASCIIVDIDGTLAHMGGKRGPYDTC